MNHSKPKNEIKVLLTENIHPHAVENLQANGYTNIITLPHALDPQSLPTEHLDARILGIRSRTQVSEELLGHFPKLMSIGCFCIGTNQVDLSAACLRGIPVFNAPHSNTRSVAELVIGLTVMLMRKIFERSTAAHAGKWMKSANGSTEVRGKSIGIVGYGHIGTQVSVLAESLGMQVNYYDHLSKLPLGNARKISSLDELLRTSDIVTMHVPETEQTKNMIGKEQFDLMKPGACFINSSRGTVVDLDALAAVIDSGHIKSAAIDVFPVEPADNKSPFDTPLRNHPSVILTPHIGGSTKEAQENIGVEVSQKLALFSDRGSSEGAVNFPALNLPAHIDTHRILHTHRNIPGMLSQINQTLGGEGINVLSQYLLTNEHVGYVVLDIEKTVSDRLLKALKNIEGTIRARVLY
ncbi:D-3-phosphoglycerate dehydrogenase [Chlamydiales bacterium SCGC AG-110-M15]|nr:D-3-phosphoglycerate dehydrogenase [Chlamydiales bacterium SCGC AG-110-M15]